MRISIASGTTAISIQFVRYPTTRIDYNITEKHRFSNAFNYQQFDTDPDTLNDRDATCFQVSRSRAAILLSATVLSNSLRSTITSNIVNEVLVAWSGAPVHVLAVRSPRPCTAARL